MNAQHRGTWTLLALVTALSWSARARATESPKAEQAARAAFEEGRALAADGKYDEACSRFEQSIALVDAIGTAFNLADCEEHRGRFARAQLLFTRVAERAHTLDQRERERVARERASALDPKLSLLQIELMTPGVALALDGELASSEAGNVTLPIEPGKHRLTASAKGKKSWSKELDVPRAGLLLTMSVPKLEAARFPAAAKIDDSSLESEGPATRPSKAQKREVQTETQRAPRTQLGTRPAVWVLAGVGAGATVAGAVFGWRYLSRNSDAKATCPSGYGCPPEQIEQHRDLVEQATTARNLSYLGFGVGAAALTTALVLHFTGKSGQEWSARAGNRNGAWAATLQGTF